MNILWSLLIITWFLAYISEKTYKNNGYNLYHYKSSTNIFAAKYLSAYFMLILIMTLTLFSGLRVSYNDTSAYIYNFVYMIPNSLSELSLDSFTSFGNYPGFYLYQVLIKVFIANNHQIFIFLTSLITNTLFVLFYKKHSARFSFSFFLFITSGQFIFGMAAMKQMLAMAIGLHAMGAFVSNKKIKFIVLLFLASTVHPFVLLFLAAYFLRNKIWTKTVVVMIIATVIAAGFFNQFVIYMSSTLGNFGVEYEASYILDAKGVNPIRLMISMVVPILSFLYQNKINLSKDKMLIIATNFSILSLLFMFLAFFGGAVLFTRAAIYFVPFNFISLPYILFYCINKKNKLLLISACIFFYCVFFYYQFSIAQPFIYRSILF